MAAIAMSGVPTLSHVVPPAVNRYTGLLAGEAIGAGHLCYISSVDGRVYRSSGAAANAAAVVDGIALQAAAVGEAVTLNYDINVRYGANLTPGIFLYLSGTTPGGLDTVASVGGTVPVGRTIDATRIHVRRSY